MKIGLLSQPFDEVEPPVDGRGSIPALTFNFATGLAARGHDVTVYATTNRWPARRPGHLDRPINHRMVYVFRPRLLSQLALGVLGRLCQLTRTRGPFMVTSWFDPFYAVQAALDARARGIELIHIQNFSQYAPLFKFVCPGIKVVLHMHCEWLNQIDGAIARKRLRHVDRILCPSDYIRRRAGQALPECVERMHVLYNGVDVARFAPPDRRVPMAEDPSIYFIGRIAPDKGVHLLVEAFERVVEVFPRAKLCLVGLPVVLSKDLVDAYDGLSATLAPFYESGEYRVQVARWRATLAQLDGDHVHHLGELSHSELIEHLRSATLLVQPSIIPEAFGMPVAEAMAMGLAVVATDGGALPELVVHEVTGLVVERGSVSSLSEALTRILRSPSLQRSMGAAGRQLALQRYDFNDLARQLDDHYAAIFEDHGSALAVRRESGATTPSAAP